MMRPDTIVRFKKLHPNAKLPTYATEGAAGMDVYHCGGKVGLFPEEGPKLIRIGLAAEIPDGYELQVRGRSSLARDGIHTHLGTIDSDYRGEIGVVLQATSTVEFIQPGDRIAQLVLAPVARARVVLAEELSDTKRGAGGFGSTGR